jgi:ATP-binding cassette, subfamily B, bacterial
MSAFAPLSALAALAGTVIVLGRRWSGLFADWRSTALGARFSNVATGVGVERRLLSFLKPHTRTVATALGLTISATVVGLAKPWPTKILVDDALGDGQFLWFGREGALAISVGLTVVFFVLGAAFGILQTRVVYGLSQRLIEDMRSHLFTHLTRLSLRYHDERGIGDSTYRITKDTYAVQSVLMNGLLPTASALLALAGTTIVMLNLDPWLTALALLTAPLAAVLSKRFGRAIRRFSTDYSEREAEVYAHAEQAMSGIRTVQAFAREMYESDRFRTRVAASRTAMMRLVTLQTVFNLAVNGVLALGLAAVTWIAAQRAFSGELTTGEVLVILAYAGTLYGPIAGLSSVFADLQQAAAGADRVFEVLDQPQPPEPRVPVPTPNRAKGHVVLEAVSFAYRADQGVLHDVAIDLKPGRLLALVGPTGAGKSTFASLLLRLYDPDGGRVLLDGIDLRDAPTSWVREQIAFVPQEPLLFPMSVRENIRYGRLDATDEEVEQAARDANILDELLVDSRGLDAPLGDRGVTLSGGQRQRVALARAFLRDAPVVLLDEPTSALDAGTEALIMEALDRLVVRRTCIVIAHRLATVHRADRIVVLDHGRVVQKGTHKQLVRYRGMYRDLHEARFGRERGPLPVAIAGASR